MTGVCFILLFALNILLNSLVFPFPFNDDQDRMRYGTFPWGTLGIIAINVVIFMVWLAPKWAEWGYRYTGYTVESFADAYYPYYETVWLYGYRDAYLDGESIGGFVAFTSIFMHADLSHLLGNMAYLWTFGHRLEDACGTWRFVAFYLVCGMIASIGSTGAGILLGFEDIAGIGASGAIGGLLGAYLLLFYGTKIQTIYLLWSILRIPTLPFRPQQKQIWKWVTNIRAFWFLFFYAGLQALFSYLSTQLGQTGGVNYFAHYFGFIAGLTIFLFLRKDLVVRYATGRAL